MFPFLVTVLASVLKAVGDLTTCQKINDTEWKAGYAVYQRRHPCDGAV